LKTSNIEFNRLQAAVVQENLAGVGIALDVRTYEFATLFADVIAGNFQLYFLQWAGGALADPDILRRAFHSSQTPPNGFNRGHFSSPEVDALLDEAATSLDAVRRQGRSRRFSVCCPRSSMSASGTRRTSRSRNDRSPASPVADCRLPFPPACGARRSCFG
jgi:hypothetical protein